MKELHIIFNDSDFKKIKKVKELSSAKSWREWIMELVKKSEEENGNKI